MLGAGAIAPLVALVTSGTVFLRLRAARAPPPFQTDSPVAIPSAWTIGPETRTSGQQGWVVVTTPARLKRGSSIASRARRTTGMWSGRQPAMAALAATASTVAAWRRGGISPIT